MTFQNYGIHPSLSQKELKTHGVLEFPCAGYTFLCSTEPEDIIHWHWHEELEVILVTEGTLELRVPGETHLVQQGDLVILNGNTLHFIMGSPKGSLQSFVFSPQLLTGRTDSAFSKKYIQPLMNFPGFNCTISQDPENIRSFIEAFSALSQNEFAYEFTVREKLTHIFLKQYRSFKSQLSDTHALHTTDSKRIEQMLDFIHTHYPENITLAQISDAGQIGERECLRCFKRTIAESPIQYLLKYRLIQSANMLIAQSETSIAEISADCGFDAPSYFSKQFKQLYQCTPKEYRKIRGNLL